MQRSETESRPVTAASTASGRNARAVQEFPELYARVLDTMTEGVSIANEDGIIVYTNPAEDRMFGYERGELIGQHVSVQNAYDLDENQRLVSGVIEQLKTQGAWTGEWHNKRKDGSEFHSLARITALTAGNARFFVCVQEDLTERAVANEAKIRLAAIVESSDDAIIGSDLNGIVRSWNKGAERIFGYTPDEIIGKPVATLAVPRRDEEIPDTLEHIRRGERVDHYVTQRRAKDGRILNVSLTVSPIRNAAGKIVGASKVARDITDQVRRWELQERLAAIVESSDDAIISKDLNGIIRSWNRGAERIFGYTADEIVGKPITTLAVPERVDEIATILARVGRGERLDHYETLRRTKDGRVLDVSLTVSPIRDANGKVIGASKVARDITDQKRRGELQERMAAIVESSDDAIISKDLNGIIQSWNKGAERIFGYKADEIIGKPVATLAVPERVEEIPDIISRIRRGERVDHYITKRQTKDGRVLTISLTVSPIKNSAGVVIGASKVARDITQQEQAQQMLEMTNNALRRANADLEQFAYAAAHDLKEPLRMVTVYSQMLNKNFSGLLGPDGQKYLNYSIEGARRMDALVQDLLAYVQASKFDDEIPPNTNSNEALQHALVALQVAIEESGACIRQEVLPPVKMHEVHLEQLFQNLLGNAIKYRGNAPPDIAIGVDRSESGTVFFVRDNGIGIGSEYKERIFELFKRLHTNEQYSGTGIGLAICKRIVEHYGERIWVESELGRGSTFYFTVPT